MATVKVVEKEFVEGNVYHDPHWYAEGAITRGDQEIFWIRIWSPEEWGPTYGDPLTEEEKSAVRLVLS